MKRLLPILLLPFPLLAQARPDTALAPFRASAHAAFTAEMIHAKKELCPGLVAMVEFSPCFNAELQQSETNLRTYREALQSAIQARTALFGAKTLADYRISERQWDLYSAGELKASADLADTPVLGASASMGTRMELIQSHLRTLDRIYYTLLHDDCGACLVDH